MKFRTSTQSEHNGMNLVPLIDVLLILLIFFIVTFAMARFETEVNISVPQAESGKTADQKVGQIFVNIRQDGTLVVAGQVVDQAELSRRFQNFAAVNKRQAIILRADTRTDYGEVFKVLDLCHRAGLHHVSFASQSPQAPAAP